MLLREWEEEVEGAQDLRPNMQSWCMGVLGGRSCAWTAGVRSWDSWGLQTAQGKSHEEHHGSFMLALVQGMRNIVHHLYVSLGLINNQDYH